jgi:hypothetical protein
MRRKERFPFGGLAAAFILVAGIGYAGCQACYNYSGANKDKAEQEARDFAKSLGMDLKGVQCNKHDTDGDGYVSCTFNLGDSVQTFECAGKNVIQDNTGCREPKIKVNNVIRGGE